jgi:hypothetical protein
MTTSPKTDLASLREGTRYLTRRPAASLGIAALGTALAALSPLLQLNLGLPDDQWSDMALTFVALLPLELYFIPRFLIAADAQTGDNPLNLPGDWRARFEERWLRAFWAKAMVALAACVGLSLAIIPGVLVLLAFGWAPMRVLLRGEPLLQAAKGSYQMMIRAWQRILLTTSVLAAIYLSANVILSWGLQFWLPEPVSAEVRLGHPLMWIGNFLGSLLSLWLSTCLLALYRRVEGAAPLAAANRRAS